MTLQAEQFNYYFKRSFIWIDKFPENVSQLYARFSLRGDRKQCGFKVDKIFSSCVAERIIGKSTSAGGQYVLRKPKSQSSNEYIYPGPEEALYLRLFGYITT